MSLGISREKFSQGGDGTRAGKGNTMEINFIVGRVRMMMTLGDEPELVQTVVSYRTTAKMTQLDVKVSEITTLCDTKAAELRALHPTVAFTSHVEIVTKPYKPKGVKHA